MQGLWTARWPDGSIEKRPYVDGKRHGQLTGRDADGDTWEISYVEGKKHGRWVRRNDDGQIVEQGSYVEDKRDGTWTLDPGGENERSVTYDRSSTYDCSQADPIRPEMVVIPGGSFRMGCVSGGDGDGLQLGERDRSQPGQLCWLRE